MATQDLRGPELLRAWLTKRGMTNKAFGALIGAAPSNVGRWLAGDWRPSLPALAEIQRATKIPMSAWLDEPKDAGSGRAA